MHYVAALSAEAVCKTLRVATSTRYPQMLHVVCAKFQLTPVEHYVIMQYDDDMSGKLVRLIVCLLRMTTHAERLPHCV